MNASKPIGVFDSGIGGLTVVRALLCRLPQENIVYFGGHGSRSLRTEIAASRPRVRRRGYGVPSLKNVKMIVVACNTVSAVALDVVQKRAKIPVVGVIIPGAKSAAAASKKKRIGVIGTIGTISSNAYANAIRQIDESISVFSRPCPLFVPLVEEGWVATRRQK